MRLIHKKKVKEKDLGFDRNRQRQSGIESLSEDLQLLVGRKNVCHKIKETKIKRLNKNYTQKIGREKRMKHNEVVYVQKMIVTSIYKFRIQQDGTQIKNTSTQMKQNLENT